MYQHVQSYILNLITIFFEAIKMLLKFSHKSVIFFRVDINIKFDNLKRFIVWRISLRNYSHRIIYDVLYLSCISWWQNSCESCIKCITKVWKIIINEWRVIIFSLCHNFLKANSYIEMYEISCPILYKCICFEVEVMFDIIHVWRFSLRYSLFYFSSKISILWKNNLVVLTIRNKKRED